MRKCMIFMGLVWLILPVQALPPTGPLPPAVRDAVPPLSVVGSGRLEWLFWDVYDATLWSRHGDWSYAQPFVLDIRYLRELSGDQIAVRGIREMRAQGYRDEQKLDAWLQIQREAFPDVGAGDHLTGVFLPPDEVRFYYNGRLTRKLNDREFAEAFFGIWLAPDTSAPDLRRRLLGMEESS